MTRKKLLIFLITITFILIGYGVAVPIAEYLREKGKVSIYVLPLLFSLYSLGQLISAPIIGKIGDVIGSKRVMLFGISSYIVVFILSINVSSIPLVLLFRFLTGVFAGATVLNIESYIGEHSLEEKRVLYFTLTSMAIALGMILGPIIGIFIIVDKLLVSVCWVILALLIIYLLAKHVQGFELPKTKGPFLFDFIKEFILITKNSNNVYIFLGFFLLGIISSSLEAMGLGFLLDNFNLESINVLYTLLLVLLLVSYILIGNPRLSEMMNKYKYSMIMLMISAVGLLTMSFTKNINVLITGFILLVLGLASVISIMSTLITLESEKNGMLLGVRNTIMGIGAIIGPIFSTYLYIVDYSLFLICLSVMCLLVVLYAYLKKLYV